MSPSSKRHTVIAVLVLLVVLLLLLLTQCKPAKSVAVTPSAPAATPAAAPSTPAPGGQRPAEVLTTATLALPVSVPAGKPFAVKWTGPDNEKDYITVVRRDAAASIYTNYRDTSTGNPVDLLAPIEPGEWEVRYVTGHSKTVLAHAPLVVTANEVTLTAPAEVVAGSVVTAFWTGPNNAGDYLTLVPKTLPDGRYGNYTDTTKGSPLTVTAPIAAGDAELRYMTGQGAKVLHRIPVRVVAAAISLEAPAAAAAGSKVEVIWAGPNNAGDYLTIVPLSLPDGQYAAYANTTGGAKLSIAAPKAGLAELRYMSGQGAKVLARRPILITP